MPLVSETMPVTLLAAENEPIFNGRSAYRSSSARRLSWLIWPSGPGDDDDIGDALAPDQLVAVVLVRADEDDRPIFSGDVLGQVVAVLELGGQP